ncbi:T9SS type B sorting domain-containing protein [Flavobacterium sufflavum]|nr:T9SS type B sorting domain-containing protein [Flavobacterium sufflavum]
MLLIGNNILGKDNNNLSDNSVNQNTNMQYIDIDSDVSTFSSSSANLKMPSTTGCSRIAYAGLYWAAILQVPQSRTDINKIKLKLPGNTAYTDITGELIYDAVVSPIAAGTNEPTNTPYACYADVTSLLSGLTDPQGTYTIANVTSSLGFNSTTGLSAGWTLFIVYEDDTATKKSITSFDGFSSIYDDKTLSIPISSFITPPSGTINILYAFASLEGDKGEVGSKTEINGKAITNSQRASNRFFNSNITEANGYFTDRVPNNSNSLGYDTGIESVLGAQNSVINYNATSATITVQVAKGQANPVFSFFNAFGVDVIAPEIKLSKIVEDINGNDIGNTNVSLGDNLYYEIAFQNIGNDNVKNFTLKDVLPTNVIFNYPADITSLPTGVTHSYNSTTRTLQFSIPNTLVEVGDVSQTIRLHVQLVSDYNQLSTACSNEIKNQAFATYQGVINTKVIQDEGSFSTTTCNFGTPQSTNFLVNIDGHTFTKSSVLCGASATLSAADGYTSYSWSTSPTGTPVVGTNQTYTATSTGTYYVTSTSSCRTIKEEITVIPFGNTITNPVIPYADEVVTCQNNGKPLPNIFLCGANATRLIQTNISDASSIEWEKLNESSCAAQTIANCANENAACQWNVLSTGSNYTVNTAGQYRVTLRYAGGCFSRFYFNVYQNLLNPTYTTKDIVCTTNGKITIGGVPAGYEYSLDGVTYLPSNVFTITTAGSYTVYIKQVGVTTNPCIFSVPNILIRKRNFSVATIVTQPLCNGDKGSIKIAANDADPQYYYSIYQGATLVNSVGPITASDYEFSGLNPATYTVRVWTDDGCDYSANIQITNPPLLTATSALTKPLTCTDGEITVYPSGGTPPYAYYVNGSTSSQSIPQIVVTNPLPSGGIYNIQVVDSKNCSTTTSITVAAIPAPVYTVTKTDILCYNNTTGEIKFNVTNANGYTLTYSIDNGVTYVANPTFSNLGIGTYNAIIKYSLAGTNCLSTPQIITINQPTAITGTAKLTTPYSCSSTATIEAQGVSGGTPGYTYSIDGINFQPGTTLSGLTNGTYSITVKDSNGCTFITNTVTITPLNPPADLTFSATALTCPTNKSNVSITTTGTNTPYTYTIIPSLPAGAIVTATGINNLSPGTYTFQVTDAKNCTYQEDYTIAPLAPINVVGTIVNNVRCLGSATGSLNFAVSGTTNYSYTINGGTPVTTQTASLINLSNLVAGTYTIIITDNNTNCTATSTVTIAAPTAALSVTTTVSPLKCNSNGQLTVNAAGGWGSYNYTLTQPDATTVGPQSSAVFTNLSQAGTYSISVTDANNCTVTNTFTLIAPVQPTASIAVTSDFCYDGTNGASLIATALGGVTPYEYNINGGAWQSSNTFSNLTPNTYTITVRDAYGCLVTLPAQTIAPQLAVNAVLTKELDCTSSPNAVITGAVTGGYTPFTYQVKINGGSYSAATTVSGSTFTYPTSTAGTYQFQITDAKGCTAESGIITINPIVYPSATTTITNVSCNSLSDGSVTIIPSLGLAPYNYSFNGSPFSSATTYSSLAAGTYSYIVKDSKDCLYNGSVTITQPTALTTTATATAFSCSTTNTKQSATITIATPVTGTAPYQYSFNGSGYNATNTLTVNDNGTDQTIPYSVRDANGCTAGNSITLSKLNPPTAGTITNSAVTCNSTTSTVTVTPTAGTGVGTLTYEITFPASAATPNTTGIFNGLIPDTYTFKVTDANGCYYTQSITVSAVNPIAIAGNKTSDVLCKGDSSGSIQYTVSGFSGTYSYVFNGQAAVTGQTSNSIVKNGLATGTYLITVTDNTTGCTANTSVTITEPSTVLALTATATNVNCNNDNSQITGTPSGGTANYTYAAVISGATAPTTYSSSNIITVDTNSATNLIWDVYVKDANGCIATSTLTIINDALPTINAPAIQCYVGSPINISITGTSVGVPTYSIGSGYQSSPNFTINAAGTYTLNLKDASGCVATTTYTVYPQLTVLPAITKELDCTASPAATITVTAAGGKNPYSYAVSTDGGSTYAPMGTNVYSTLVAGTFQFRVTDANNCITTTTTTINPLTPITATTTNVNPSCNGASDGSVQIIPSGGVAPYTYSNDGITYVPSSLFSGLGGGNYTFYIKDSKGCFITKTVTLTDPVTLAATASVTPFTCSVSNTKQAATITVTATSGTGTAPYQYSLNGSGYSAVNTLTLNDNGLDQPYTYSVRDSKGCIVSGGGTLLKLNPPTDLSFTAAPITCTATTTTVTATATNGVGTLTYEITFPLASATLNTSGVFAGLSPGTYIFKVTDANGCYYTESHIVNPVTPIAVIGSKLSDVLCKGDSSGSIQYTVSGFSGTYSYVFNSQAAVTAQTSNSIVKNGLATGTYLITVTDNTTGCTANTSVTITEPTTALTFTATPTNVNCNDDNSQITVTALGGTANYTYAAVISGATAPTIYSNSNVIIVDTNSGANLSWDVYVKDANGCVTNNTLSPTIITLDPMPTVSTPALASNQCSVSIGFTFTATGTGITPLSYSINGGVSYQSSPVFTVNVPGSYAVTVKDGNGCTATSLTPTIVSSPITTNAILTKDLTCSSPTNATIDVTTNGGKLPYSYKVKIGAGSYGSSIAFAGTIFTYTASTADTYQFEITDANGCTKETNITTTTAVLPTASYTAVNPTCNGNSDGSIKLTALTGEGPFTYSINGGVSFVTTNVFGGLVAGSYSYIVRDNKGCDASGTITLNNPVLIVPNIVMYPIVCNANTPGSFDVSVTSGGVAPFTYNLYDSSYNLLDTYSETGASPTTVHNFGGLTFGDYYITIVDANGCQFSSSKQRITTPPFLTLDAVTLGGDCIVGATVDLTVVTGGVAPYKYSIFGQPLTESAPTAATTYTFNGLLHGTSYFFQVKDNNNCISVLEVPIPTISSIGVVIDNKSNVTCNGVNNGIINYTVSGFDTSVTTIEYELLNPLTNSPISPAINGTVTGVAGGPISGSISGLKQGDYLLKVKESTGTLCSALIPFNITQPIQPLNAIISNETNANCNTGAQITVSATGGTGPYQYAFVQDGAPQAGAYNNSNLGVLNPFPLPLKLDWDIWVKDANGCEFKIDKTITVDPSPTINTVGLQCFTGSGLSITLTGTYVGTPTYSIGGAYQASPSFTINSPGTYNVSIKDNNGCIATTTYDVKPQLLLQADLIQDLTCSVDASITLTPSGGTGTYTNYEVSFNAGGFTPAISSFITNTAGSYIFRVTDSQGCQAISNEIIVTPNTTPTATFTQTNVSCNGGSDGSIVINAANGIAPYQYSIDNGATYQPSNVFTGLNAAGTYTIIVKDSKSCTSAASPLAITEPTIVGGTAVLTQGLTCGAGNATQAALVTVTGSGGTGSYTYSFNGGLNYSSSNTYSTNTTGVVTAYIKDTNGCISAVLATANVPALNPPTDLNISGTPVYCAPVANQTSTVTLTTTNGVGTLSYAIISPASATTNVTGASSGIFTGLLPDTYLFQATDANGCTYQESYTVNPVTNITVSGQLISDVTCNPGSNGQVLFTLGNFAGMYSYSLDGGTTVITGQTNPTITLSGLTTGTQTIIVTDETTGCTATTSVAVTQPAPLALVANPFINANCNFGAQVSVTASGGVAPYSYSYVISGASAGTYSTSASAVLDPAIATSWDVYVKDANGCIITAPLAITITKDPLPIIVMPASQCFVGTPLTIDLSNGQTVAVGPATYTINGSNQTSPIYTINAPGTYKLSIVDANGCSSNVLDYIVQPQLSLNAALTKELDCTISPDAIVTLTAGGGTAPYTLYEYSTNAGTSYTAMGSNVLTISTAGTYIFRVTDTQGCQAISSEVTITPKTTPTFTFTQTNVSCNGGSDGSIVITAANGIAPYQYSIDNGANYQPSNVFTGLNAAGTYTIIVKDNKSCTSATSPLAITEPTIVGGTALLTQGLTCGAGNATQAALVTVTGSGGTGSYTYSFNGGLNYSLSNTYSTNTAGVVTAYIKDANGCISAVPATANVQALNPPTDLNFVSTTVTCLALTSDVTLTTTNGVGTLSYAIISPATATSNVTGASSGIFTGLLPDTYLFQVTDANFCTYKKSYTVNPVNNITVAGLVTSDVKCFGDANGTAEFTVANSTGSYTSALITGSAATITQTANKVTITGLIAGNYTLEVTDSTTGCTAQNTITINQPTNALSATYTTVNANCNLGAQVKITASGGTPNYRYAVLQDGATPIAADYSNNNNIVLNPAINTLWDAYVLDANNCVTKTDVTIATDPAPTITLPALASDQCTSAGASYTFTATGTGVAPLSYSIGTGYQSSNIFTVTAAGTYTVTVKDANGCTASNPITIYPALNLTAAITSLPSCANNDGVITVAATGGSGSYNYGISPSLGITQTANVFSNIPSGTYTITMTDLITNCNKNVSVILSPATPVTFDPATVTNVSCKGGNNGTITVNLASTNDNPIYSYAITAPVSVAPQASNVFTNLAAGNYTVEVTSGRNCKATQNISVTEPTAVLTATATASPFSCALNNSVNASTVTITGAGGTPTYTYSIDGTNYFTSNSFAVIDTGAIQTITVYVKDANGCTANNTVTINPLPKLISTVVNQTKAITCTNDELVSISVTGGSGNFSYQLLPAGTPQPSNSFSLTAPGTYYFQVNDVTTGCYITTLPYTIAPFNTIKVVATATTAVTCFGDSNGALAINVTGYTGPYNYNIKNNLGVTVSSGFGNTALNPQTINGLAAANYTVEVTETTNPFCISTSNTVTIFSPSTALNLVASETSNVTCTNDKGTISAIATGGWGSYQYELTGTKNVSYSSNGTFTNLTVGTYTINAKDLNGCVVSRTVTLTIPNPINATVTPNTTVLSCFGDKNATITTTNVTGGQGSNYSYILNMISPTVSSSGPQLAPTFSGLGAGTYTITVKDGYNCSFTSANIVIVEPTIVKTNLIVASTQTCLNQTQLTLTASGGTAPYTYSADNVTYTPAPFASSVSFPVVAGTYSYYVKDVNGCIATISNNIKIDPLPALVINLDKTNAFINCKGDNSGDIAATAQGGLGNYIYSLLDGAGLPIAPSPTQLSPGNFTGLFAGNYMVKVTSGDCTTTSAVINITEPTAPLAAPYTTKNVNCNGAKNGEIIINASGGTGTIQYAISPNLNQFYNTNTFTNLAPGNYDVIVQDVLGCYIKINFDITEPNLLTASTTPNSIIPEICAGDKDGAFSIDIAGGTAPYSVSLDNLNGTYTTGTLSQTEFDFTGLTGGNHVVYIRDAAGCTTDWSVPLPQSVNMSPVAAVSYDCVNNAASNLIKITVDASITNPADVDYSLDGGTYQASNIFTNIPAGTHYVTTRHTNGCEQRTSDFNIVQVDPLTLVLNDGGLNEIVATAAGGGGNYQYTLNGESYGNTSNFIIYKSGDYTVTVTDANGCVASATRHFEYIDVCIPNHFTPNGDGIEDGWAPGCTINYTNLTFDIFDRYGRKVATYRLGQYWDGKYDGKELPSGDYWYVLKLNDVKDPREFVGHFTLYR